MYLVCYPVIFDFFSLPSFLIYSLIYTNNTFITFIKITQNKKNYIYFVRLSQRSNCTLVFYLYLLCMFWFHTTPSTLSKSRYGLRFYFELQAFLVPVLLAPTVACLTQPHSRTYSLRGRCAKKIFLNQLISLISACEFMISDSRSELI